MTTQEAEQQTTPVQTETPNETVADTTLATAAESTNATPADETTEPAPAPTTSSGGKAGKRLNLFNPFKSAKKEGKEEETPAPAAEEEGTEEAAAKTPTAEKRKSKGFGSFFSGIKVMSPKTPPADDSASSPTHGQPSGESQPVELPKIEQLQPIETSAVVEGAPDKAKETATSAAEQAAETAADTANDAVAAVTSDQPSSPEAAPTSTSPKRQSLIGKFFGNKKKEVKEEEQTDQEQPKQEQQDDNEKENPRPSSPIGRRLTDFFKLPKKSQAPAAPEEENNAADNDHENGAPTEEAETPRNAPETAATATTPAPTPIATA